MKLTYIALRDCLDLQGRFWFSGFTRKLTEEQAARYLEEEKATHYTPPPPRRYVEITDERAGTTERITWGEYLKRRYKSRTKKNLNGGLNELQNVRTRGKTLEGGR